MNKILFGLWLGAAWFGGSGAVAGEAPPKEELVAAVECRDRDGLPNWFDKLKRSEPLRIAYLGGSITAQAGWRPKTLAWFQKEHPATPITEINAAIGGTGSDLGVFRLEGDVLARKPDLLFVEFAVNDSGAPPAQIVRCMEGIVRQTWARLPECDICFAYTLTGNMVETLNTGKFPRAASVMERVADHYGIPSIHMGLEVARLAREGRLILKGPKPATEAEKQALGGKIVFSPDDVHPYVDTGHELYCQAVVRGLERMRGRAARQPHQLGAPLAADHWQAARMAPLDQAVLGPGWRKLEAGHRLASSFAGRLPGLWTAGQAGDTLTFRFKGTAAGIYDLVGPDCGQLAVRLDGQPARIVPRFDSFCTYHRLSKFMIGEGLPDTLHTVAIEIHPDEPDKARILAQRGEKMDDPKRFAGRAWHAGAVLLIGELAPAETLARSAVPFMYEAGRETYEAYGATLLAWGGKPTPQALAAARGVTFFGSVGMVTEFSRYYERFPDTYEQGLCRDAQGQPIKVPWLTDHQHRGIPYWWCCTRQPQFQQYIRERVLETVQAGAAGVHIDDHLGTAGGLFTGACFCGRCVAEFPAYLRALPAGEKARLGLGDPDGFDFRAAVAQWRAGPGAGKPVSAHPLWGHWEIYQCRAAAGFMKELRAQAAQAAGHPVPMSANAGLLWPRHLVDYQALDFFSAEIDHQAHQRRFSDLPLAAYRLADAMGRPLAATASGQDWAFIKEQNLPGLVRGWIALSYAAGNYLMTPHRQWCYTTEKGTHWYQGPVEKFAPLYQFVRRHAELFDGLETYADVTVILPHRSFMKERDFWFKACNQLAQASLSYDLLVAGDDLVDHPLPAAGVRRARALLAPKPQALDEADRKTLAEKPPGTPIFDTVEQAVAALKPAVRAEAAGTVRLLPRVNNGRLCLHLLNYGYDAGADDVQPLTGVKIKLDTAALGIPANGEARLDAPESEPLAITIADSQAMIPKLGLWGVLSVKK